LCLSQHTITTYSGIKKNKTFFEKRVDKPGSLCYTIETAEKSVRFFKPFRREKQVEKSGEKKGSGKVTKSERQRLYHNRLFEN
jgi:hypothetical protein